MKQAKVVTWSKERSTNYWWLNCVKLQQLKSPPVHEACSRLYDCTLNFALCKIPQSYSWTNKCRQKCALRLCFHTTWQSWDFWPARRGGTGRIWHLSRAVDVKAAANWERGAGWGAPPYFNGSHRLLQSSVELELRGVRMFQPTRDDCGLVSAVFCYQMTDWVVSGT